MVLLNNSFQNKTFLLSYVLFWGNEETTLKIPPLYLKPTMKP